MKHTKVMAVLNQKGGVGKTSTVINLAARYAETGKRVVAIDLDPQGNLSEVLAADTPTTAQSVATLFDSPKSNIHDCIVPTTADNLALIPATQALSRVIELSMTRPHRERILAKHLAKLDGDYDLVLLDCPPNLSLTTINAMMVADLFVTPIDAGKFALTGFAQLLEALEEVTELEREAIPFVVFRNEHAAADTVMNEFLDSELEAIKDNVLESRIRRATAISQATVAEVPLKQYKPSESAVVDYRKLATELAQRINL